MNCQKCNSEKIITLANGSQACQDCKTIQNKPQSSGCLNCLAVMWGMVSIFIGFPLMIADNINKGNEKQEQVYVQQQQEDAYRQSQLIRDQLRNTSEINRAQTEMLSEIYSGRSNRSNLVPLRRSRYNRCDCPYDIFYYAGEERYCGNNSAYVRTGGRSPACFVGEY